MMLSGARFLFLNENQSRTSPRSSLLPLQPTQRSTINFDPNIDLNTAKELSNIIPCIAADLHRNGRNPIGATTRAAQLGRRAA
jgi:hypothetical protein